MDASREELSAEGPVGGCSCDDDLESEPCPERQAFGPVGMAPVLPLPPLSARGPVGGAANLSDAERGAVGAVPADLSLALAANEPFVGERTVESGWPCAEIGRKPLLVALAGPEGPAPETRGSRSA